MRKIIPVLAAGAAGLLIAGGSFAYASADKAVTLSVDGQQTTEQTYAGTVGDFLAAEGISVGEKDVVAPALDSKLSDGTRVSVLYGREVSVTVDGKKRTFWTTATNVDTALAGLNLKLDGAQISTSRSSSIGREGIAMAIATQKVVTLDNAGKKQTVTINGQTVADVLKAAKVKPDSDDKVSPSVKTAVTDGTKITFVQVDVKTTSKSTTIAHSTQRIDSASITRGTTKVSTTGRDGAKATQYTLTYENGKLVKKVKGDTSTTRKPVTEIVLVGTKPLPVPKVPEPTAPKSSPSTPKSTSESSAPKTPSASVASGSVWDKIAQCESGGNWAINTGNGFYGGLQFTLSTWKGYGGSGMPQNASREAQIAVAKKVQAAQGWGAWPACTSKLGLR